MERAKGSAIWSYFTLPKPASSTATCNICKVKVPRGGTKPSSFNTTNLIKHLQKFHVKEHSEFVEQDRQKGGGMKQLTLKEMKERGEKFPMNSVQASRITDSILKFVAIISRCFSISVSDRYRPILNLRYRYRYRRWKKRIGASLISRGRDQSSSAPLVHWIWPWTS